MLKNSKGETIIEALVGFLIAAVSAAALSVSVLSSGKLLASGKKTDESFYFEKELFERFLAEDSFSAETVKLIVISDGENISSDEVLYYSTDEFKISGFKKIKE